MKLIALHFCWGRVKQVSIQLLNFEALFCGGVVLDCTILYVLLKLKEASVSRTRGVVSDSWSQRYWIDWAKQQQSNAALFFVIQALTQVTRTATEIPVRLYCNKLSNALSVTVTIWTKEREEEPWYDFYNIWEQTKNKWRDKVAACNHVNFWTFVEFSEIHLKKRGRENCGLFFLSSHPYVPSPLASVNCVLFVTLAVSLTRTTSVHQRSVRAVQTTEAVEFDNR